MKKDKQNHLAAVVTITFLLLIIFILQCMIYHKQGVLEEEAAALVSNLIPKDHKKFCTFQNSFAVECLVLDTNTRTYSIKYKCDMNTKLCVGQTTVPLVEY